MTHISKEHILEELRRTAASNGGTPLGKRRFLAETNISEADWSGKYWIRWNDAIREAGLSPNRLITAYSSEYLLEKLSELVRDLQHFPVSNELTIRSRSDQSFPSPKTFERFGTKRERISALRAYALSREYRDVVSVCDAATSLRSPSEIEDSHSTATSASLGYVYLVQHGKAREFKIGRTMNPVRRAGEIGIELPQKLVPLHVIETDDPAGVEAYWHRRFASKRLKGEWFSLTADDVRAFRKWKRIA